MTRIKRSFLLLLMLSICCLFFSNTVYAEENELLLGNEVLQEKYHYLIAGKRLGLITNQSGVDKKGISTINKLAQENSTQLTALYGPEHGIDGKAAAGAYVKSYIHNELGIPVYSLYGSTRKPDASMLKNIDVLLYDIQDIGARTYTYISTLNYCMLAAKENNKPIIVLDRPNPLGGLVVDGPVLEDKFKTFVGVDNLPMSHGMTVGELALYFNRNIGVDLTVIPMQGYQRDMIYQETGLSWVQTSPNIPDIQSVFGYMSTGLGEGTGIYQADKFKWIGGKGIDAQIYADLLNNAGLTGVTFIPEIRGSAGGVRLNIIDYKTFNPARTGIYALTIAHSLNDFQVPQSGSSIVMFDKIMGTDKIGDYLKQGLTPQQIENNLFPQLQSFRNERQKYLIYDNEPYIGTLIGFGVEVDNRPVVFDVRPYIDNNNRLMVPLRAIVEALGAVVNWNSADKSITIAKQADSLLLRIGMINANVNGVMKKMDTYPVIRNGRTMVPLRFVGEYLNTVVNWDTITKNVTIKNN